MTSRTAICALACALWSVVAMAQPAKPVTIKHAAPREAIRGEEFIVRANITAPDGVYLPTLFYRAKGDTRYYTLPMLPVPGALSIYAASVPGLFTSQDIEYYVEAYDTHLRGPGRVGAPNAPIGVKVVEPTIAPSQVVVRSDPSGAQVVLDGVLVGDTPWMGVVSPGPHELLLRRAGYLELVGTLEVPEGRDLELERTLPPEAEDALFSVNSDPGLATVWIDEQKLGDTPILAPSPEGKYTLTLDKPGYARAERTILFSKDRSVETSFSLVKLPPEPALAITTDPPGAEVTVNGQRLGTTPFIGVVPQGEHSVVLSLEGRRTSEAQILMPEDRDLDLRFALGDDVQREPVVALSSEPSGATIAIDGVVVEQKTPYIGQLPAGPHKISFSLDGYEPYERSIVMSRNDVEVTIGLVPVPPPPGPAKVVVEAEQEGVAVTVDGKPAGATPVTVELDAGAHVVVAKKDGFRTLEERFVVQAGESVRVRLALTPIEKGIEDPLLSVRTEPEGATVTVDGVLMESGTPFARAFAPGKHTVVVSREGYHSREETFELPKDREFELRYAFVLEPLRRRVQLQSASQALEPKASGPIIDQSEVRTGTRAGRQGVAPKVTSEIDVGGPTQIRRLGAVAPSGIPTSTLVPAVLGGSGVVLAGVGALFIVKAMGTGEDIANPGLEFEHEALIRRHSRELSAGVGLMGAGALVAATGAVLAVTGFSTPGSGGDAETPKVERVGVAPTAGGGVVSVGGRF